MVDLNTAPNASPHGDTPDTTPRGDGPDRLAQLRARQSAEQHAAQLAAQTRVEEAERNLAASLTRVAELEAAASKAATIEGAQRHDIALAELKHGLTMEGERQRWALDDARRDRDRNLAEVDRARNAAVEAQRIAEIRQQCDALNQQNTEFHAAIASEESRITTSSMAFGLLLGAIGGGLSAMRRKGKTPVTAAGIVGVGGIITAASPLAAAYLKPSASQLPPPVTAAGWDAYLLIVTADNARLRSQHATLQAKTLSLPTVAISAAGVGSLTYAVAS